MATRLSTIHTNQSAINYINKKGINELFEAIMTALMVNKPDDHLTFIRECLDKIQNNPQRLRWDFFLATSPNISKTTPLTRPTLVKTRQKALPPVRNSISLSRANQKSDYRTSSKSVALPPIENNRRSTDNHLPIVFILSSDNTTNLCSKLIERYNQIEYLYINDIASIDDDENIDLKKYEHRFDAVQHEIEQRRSIAQGYLITGHLDEKNFSKKWLEKLGRIDLIILLSNTRQAISNQNLHIIYIDSHQEFDTVLAKAIQAVDEIFPLNTLSNDYFRSMENKFNHAHIPIIFCIDNYHVFNEEKSNGKNSRSKRVSIDEEFDLSSNQDEDDETNNSFIQTLCQRLAEQFSYKHIHYGETNKNLMTFEQLKSSIIESMSTVAGFIIDHFPTSLDELDKFQTEIGPCSVLIHIGEHQVETKDNDLNTIVEKFKRNNKAIYIDCRMEVDEIYEDLKNDILKQI